MKLENETEGTLFIKSWNDLEAGAILSAKIGPMFVKYLQNLLASSHEKCLLTGTSNLSHRSTEIYSFHVSSTLEKPSTVYPDKNYSTN